VALGGNRTHATKHSPRISPYSQSLKYDIAWIALTCLNLLPSSRALLEGKSIRNLIRGAWASVYEAYVVVVTATTLLLKLDAQVHNWVSKGTSLEGQARLSSWLFSLLSCKLSLILPKHLYSVTAVVTATTLLLKLGARVHNWAFS